jgi:hypothetical protein
MRIIGLDQLERVASGECAEAKLLLNHSAAVFFPATQQHRDQKVAGVSYDDDSAGNALAGMIRPRVMEIRFHRQFTDAAVAHLVRKLCVQPSLQCLRDWSVTYQGRPIAAAET